MAIQPIGGADKLNSGFRVKYNETIGSIIVSGIDTGIGTVRLYKYDGSFITVNLTASFFTQEQINLLFVQSGLPDKVLTPITITVNLDNTITFAATSGGLIKWRINSVVYQANSPIIAPFTPAADGFYRKDLVYFTVDGLEILQGVEDSTSAIAPSVPDNCVPFTILSLFGGLVSPQDGDLSGYAEKSKDNYFSGINEFKNPVKGAQAQNPNEFITLAQAEILTSAISNRDPILAPGSAQTAGEFIITWDAGRKAIYGDYAKGFIVWLKDADNIYTQEIVPIKCVTGTDNKPISYTFVLDGRDAQIFIL